MRVAGQPRKQTSPRRPTLWRRLASTHPYRRGTLLIMLALVVEYLVLPQVGGVGHSLHLLRTCRPSLSATCCPAARQEGMGSDTAC